MFCQARYFEFDSSHENLTRFGFSQSHKNWNRPFEPTQNQQKSTMSEQQSTTPPAAAVVPPTPVTQGTPGDNDMGTTAQNLFPENSGETVVTVQPLRSARKRFTIKNKSPSGDEKKKYKKDPNAPRVKVIKLISTCVSQPITGMIIVPLGFQMDRFLADILYNKANETIDTKTFLEITDIVHRVLTVKDENGLTIQHQSKDGKMYPTRAVFLPMDPPGMDTEEKIQTILVKTFSPALWNNIDTEAFPWASRDELPRIIDYNRDVITKTCFSDAIVKHEDIIVIARMVLKRDDVSVNEWLMEEPANFYTLFHELEMSPKDMAKHRIPFTVLSVKDKKAKTEYDAAVEKAKRAKAAQKQAAGK